MKLKILFSAVLVTAVASVTLAKNSKVSQLLGHKGQAKFIPEAGTTTAKAMMSDVKIMPNECKNMDFIAQVTRFDSRLKPGMEIYTYASSQSLNGPTNEALGVSRIVGTGRDKNGQIIRSRGENLLFSHKSRAGDTTITTNMIPSITTDRAGWGPYECKETPNNYNCIGDNYSYSMASVATLENNSICDIHDYTLQDETTIQHGQYQFENGTKVPAVETVTRMTGPLVCKNMQSPGEGVLVTTYVTSFDVPVVEAPHVRCNGAQLSLKWQIMSQDGKTVYSVQTQKILQQVF